MISDTVHVLFKMPDWVREGLNSGALERAGGVIRHTTGKKPVAIWLREVGTRPVDYSQVDWPRPAAPVLDLQVFTLGMNAATFQVINRKLDVLLQRIGDVEGQLQVLHADIAWLDRKADVTILAGLAAAMEQCRWAVETGRPEFLMEMRGDLVGARTHYRLLLQALITTDRVFCRPELYAGYYAHMCLAGVALTRVDLILDGEAAGIRRLQELHEQASGAQDLLRGSVRDFDRNATTMVRMGASERAALNSTLKRLREGLDHVASYRAEIEFCAANGIKFEEWEKIGSEIEDSGVIGLVPNA